MVQVTVAIPKTSEELIKQKPEPKLSHTIKVGNGIVAEISPEKMIIRKRTCVSLSGETLISYTLDKNQFQKMYNATEDKGYSTALLLQDEDHELSQLDLNYCELDYCTDTIVIESKGFVSELAQVFKNYIVFSRIDSYDKKVKMWFNVEQFNRISEVAKQVKLIEEIID
jgi:hypothetical protein